ncbi:MAG: hypothetical protein KA004_10690 [Verrucomicrobiales bacterium]|nr:hypothetical protein [Verrucomicrobiales bacterium]
MNSAFLSTDLLACATCIADGGGGAQQATNNAIFLMLGALVVVFSGLGWAAFSFMRRSSRLAAAQTSP